MVCLISNFKLDMNLNGRILTRLDMRCLDLLEPLDWFWHVLYCVLFVAALRRKGLKKPPIASECGDGNAEPKSSISDYLSSLNSRHCVSVQMGSNNVTALANVFKPNGSKRAR